MRILYYSPHPRLSMEAPTGYGTHMREMVGAWRKAGIEVKTLIAADLGGRQVQEPKRSEGVIETLRGWKRFVPRKLWETARDIQLIRFDLRMERRLRKAVEEYRPDVIYERVAYLQNSGVRTAKAFGVTHIAEINAPFPEERKYFSGDSYLVGTAADNLRQILIQTDGITTVSTALADYFGGIAEEAVSKTLVLPNCVNPEEVIHGGDRPDDLREELHLGSALVLGFVGSIFPYHGVDLLIEAFAGLPKAPRTKLLIVGDGASLPELRALAKRLGVFGDVIFTGSVPHRDVYLYIELMDICCMAKSNWYGSPVKIFEYGLLKKPVIAPDTEPVKEVMDKTTGVIVKPDTESISDAMRLLISDESLRKRLAETWHHKVLKEHTWDTAAAKVLTLCE